MILAGDIGGTKTNLALFNIHSPLDIETIASEKYHSQDQKSLEEIIKDFVTKHPHEISLACFGIAGAVHAEHVKTTNLTWEIDAKSISELLKNCPVHLINDLEANAWGIEALKDDEFHILQAGNPKNQGNKALISAGTGLGQAGLFFDGKRYHPYATEGGHADFSPRNKEEVDLLNFLMKQFGHVSYERVLSGQGLHNIFCFLRDTNKTSIDSRILEEMKVKDPAFVISEHALNKSDPTCEKALDIMVSLYGAEAGNLSLRTLCSSGLYIGGGIAPKILEKLESPLFIDSYLGKGRFSPLLKTFPVKVILNDRTALLGAGLCAYHKGLNER